MDNYQFEYKVHCSCAHRDDIRQCEVIVSIILNLGMRTRWMVSFKHRSLYSRHPRNVRLGGPHIWC